MASPLDIQPQYSLRALNTFGIDAKAAHYLEVTDVAQLHALYRDTSLRAIPRLILGGGSNVLLTHDFPGLVLHIATLGMAVTGEDEQQ